MGSWRVAWPFSAVCVGWILGTAWHLECVELQSPGVYAVWVLVTAITWLSAASLLPRLWPGWRQTTMPPALGSLGLVVMSACLSMGMAGWRAAVQWEQRLDPALEGVDLVLQGVVARLPQVQSEGLRFRFEVERARYLQAPEGWVEVPARVVLNWSNHPGVDGVGSALPALRAGDRWLLPVRLKSPHGALNPHGADLELWLWSEGVMAVGQVRPSAPEPAQARRLATAVAHPIERWRQACRDRLWQQGLEPRRTAIVAALLLGDQAGLDPQDWDVFRRTGVAHLMSISGLHITLLAMAVRAVLTGLWRRGGSPRRPWSLVCPAVTAGRWGGLLAAGLYAVFSGWGLPAQRTVLMLGVSVLLSNRGLRWPGWATWLLACAVVLAWDPWAWLQAGFWLSFVAVGLLMAWDGQDPSPPSDGVVPEPAGERPASASEEGMSDTSMSDTGVVVRVRGMVRVGAQAIARMRARMMRAAMGLYHEQWRITLGLAPLTLCLFREVSGVGMLANVLAIPWVTLCVTPLSWLGVVWPGAWSLAVQAVEFLQQGLSGLLALGIPTWSVAAFPSWVVVAGVLGAGLCCLPAPLWLRCWGVPLLVPALGWQASLPPQGEVDVVVADVGQGQAVLVRTARHVLLYDAGPRYSQDMDAGQRVVVPLLQSLDARLDRLVLSHRDVDHTGGAQAVLALHPQADVLGSLPADSALARRDDYRDCESGQSWTWDGVYFEVVHPDRETPRRTASNAWSCVLRVRAAGSSVLLTGDIEAREEAELVQRLGTALQTEVMLVPHHGSRTSSTAVWLDAVQPRWAWVQAGYRNRFGHPAADVLTRYLDRHIVVLQTSRCGAIQWSSAQPARMVCERDVRRRYWHHVPP